MRWGLLVLVAMLALTGCGGEDETAGADGEFQFQAEPRGDAEHWAEVWCDIDGTMSRNEVIELMGEPTQEFDAESGAAPQSQWDAGTFHYTVFYDGTGAVEQAYVNPLEIEDSGEPAPFHCELVRHFS